MATTEKITLEKPKEQAPPTRIVVQAEPGKVKAFPLLPDIMRKMAGWICIEPSEPGGNSFVPVLHPALMTGEGFMLCRTVVMRAQEV